MNPISTEVTTGATDALLALLALGCAAYLRRVRGRDPFKVALWAWVLGLLAAASALGAVAHALLLPDSVRELIWHPLYLLLGLVVALFVVASVRDRFGEVRARTWLPVMLAVGVGFYLASRVAAGTFLVFVAYEAVAMAVALVLYLLLALTTRSRWSWLMVLGIGLNVAAAAIQASGSVRLHLLVPLDHNGVFHLVQMAAIVVLTAGVGRSLTSEPASARLRESEPDTVAEREVEP